MKHNAILKSLGFVIIGVLLPGILIVTDSIDGYFAALALIIPTISYLFFRAKSKKITYIGFSLIFSFICIAMLSSFSGGGWACVALIIFGAILIGLLLADFLGCFLYGIAKKRSAKKGNSFIGLNISEIDNMDTDDYLYDNYGTYRD